jgi:hypothetical protein
VTGDYYAPPALTQNDRAWLSAVVKQERNSEDEWLQQQLGIKSVATFSEASQIQQSAKKSPRVSLRSGIGALSSYGGGGCGFGAGGGYAGAGHLDMPHPSAYGGSLGTSAGCPGSSSFAASYGAPPASYGAPPASYGAGSYGLGGLGGGMPRTNSFTSYPGASGFGGGGSYVPPVTPGSYVPPAQPSYSAPFGGGAFPTTSSFTAGANYSSLHTGMPTVGSFAAQPQFQFFPETGGAGGLTAPSAGYSATAGGKGPLTSGAPPKSYMPAGPKAAGPPPVGAKPPPMPASKAPHAKKKGRRGCC